jgi:DNA-directed RNA polymerase subunit RPC12/RpoP
MIRVSLQFLIFIYLFVLLGAIFLLWLTFEARRRRREIQALRYRMRCTICAFDFEDRSSDLLPRCPHCGSLNERYRFGTL